MTDSANSHYVAGSCNIGPVEIRRRYQVAILGAVLYLLLAISFIASDASTATRLFAFIPAISAAVGFNQARRKFCLAYGFAGLFSFERLGDVTKVVDAAALKADRAYALKILYISILPALALTALVIVI